MKTKLCVLAVAAVVVWGLKRHYADARADDLWWILRPTAGLVGIVTGTTFIAVPGEGYLSHERLFLIEKSCAGINFMIAAFGMLVFALFHRVESGVSGAGVLAASLLASYGAAVLVNATRITIAMWLAAHPIAGSTFTRRRRPSRRGDRGVLLRAWCCCTRSCNGSSPARPWRGAGHDSRDTDSARPAFRRVALPLGCYYVVTLGLPLANGAAQSGAAFVNHALIVLVVPPLLIVLACAIRKGVYVCARVAARPVSVRLHRRLGLRQRS